MSYPTLCTDTSQSAPATSSDYTIMNFDASVLSKQYNRYDCTTVPFCLAVPGPASLRGRNTAPEIEKD